MHRWRIRDRVLEIGGCPLIMGIVNVTPDSFSDGGKFFDAERAISHALEMVEQGADLLDIGGESTRPGAIAVDEGEEMRRVLPCVEALSKQTATPLSIDTSKGAVAKACFDVGAHILNDVTAMTGDTAMIGVVKDAGAGVILMHMQGTPATMQAAPHYDDVVEEIAAFLKVRMTSAVSCGLAEEQIVLDPGVGFGKTFSHNMELLARLGEFRQLGRPICLGVSRKGFLGKITGPELERRVTASLAVACHVVGQAAAQILRVHDVRETRDAVAVVEMLKAKQRLIPNL